MLFLAITFLEPNSFRKSRIIAFFMIIGNRTRSEYALKSKIAFFRSIWYYNQLNIVLVCERIQ